MPFPESTREEALVRSRRHCCVCHIFAGRDSVVHHIEQEADGGANTIDNAIVLCSRCHSEAGHYNPRHPLGTKYAPSELRRHRDEWWKYCEQYRPEERPVGHLEVPENARGASIHKRAIGVVWSYRADIPADSEPVEIDGRLLTSTRYEDQSIVRLRELFVRTAGGYLVYESSVHRADWCEGCFLADPEGEPWYTEHARSNKDAPELNLEQVQNWYGGLAASAGLARVRRL